MPPRDRTGHDGHVGVVAVADAHGLLVREVDAVQAFDERRHEVAARLLAIGDDVDARVLLVEERQAHRVLLALRERVAFELPRRPQRLGLGEPGGLRQAAGDRGAENLGHGGTPLEGGRRL